jgi:hypothetical protein
MIDRVAQLGRPLRVTFMTTCGRNVGDEFIREGIRSFFDDLRVPYHAFYVDKHDLTTLSRRVYDEPETLSDKFRDADVIVQAGAPVYWSNGKHTSCTSEWAQALWLDRIFRLGASRLVLNLGAGAGQKSENDLDTLAGDATVCRFAVQAGQACAWTTVRDPLASTFLNRCRVPHAMLPCPAFHAARRVAGSPTPADALAVNLMELAGHYRLKPQTDPAHWRSVIEQLLPLLRSRHRLVFVAHDTKEADFQRRFAQPGEMIFLADSYGDYMTVYGKVSGFVGNRVHGGVCVAGFGRPAVIIGNDCRIGIARPMGIPAIDSSEATAEWIAAELAEQFALGEELAERRLGLRERSARRHVERIGSLIAAYIAQARAAAA